MIIVLAVLWRIRGCVVCGFVEDLWCGGWKLISIEFSAEERGKEGSTVREREVLQHITFNGDSIFGATLVVKKMDQTYCLCDMFISIAFDHAT